MAWGIFMTGLTLFGMLALAMAQACTEDGAESDVGKLEGTRERHGDITKKAA